MSKINRKQQSEINRLSKLLNVIITDDIENMDGKTADSLIDKLSQTRELEVKNAKNNVVDFFEYYYKKQKGV